MRFSPLHWFFVCIELEISLGYDFITLSCKQWRWDWLLHYLYHQITRTSWVYQLAILSQSELSVIGIICPVTLLQTLNDFKKMNFINFLWTSDWHWNWLLYFLTLLTTGTVFPLTNKLFTFICATHWSPCYMTMVAEATHGSSHE